MIHLPAWVADVPCLARLLSRRRSQREARTHDFTGRYPGHDFTLTPRDGGQRLTGFVWSSAGLSVGDYLILPNGATTTRYVVDTVRWCRDPDDMWSVGLRYAPREETPHA